MPNAEVNLDKIEYKRVQPAGPSAREKVNIYGVVDGKRVRWPNCPPDMVAKAHKLELKKYNLAQERGAAKQVDPKKKAAAKKAAQAVVAELSALYADMMQIEREAK